MKIRTECQVECRTAIPSTITIEHKGLTYVFRPGPGGDICRIEILSPVPRPEEFYSETVQATDRPPHFIFRADENLLNSLLREFQEIESHLALEFNLSRIRWDEMKYELIPETEEEREKVKILGSRITRRYHEPPVRVDAKSLEELIHFKSRYESLVVPLAFYREGKLDFYSLRFINAFFNFYFIVEGLYGRGKTKNQLVERAFKSSPTLQRAVKDTLSMLAADHPETYRKLRGRGIAVEGEAAVDQAIKFMVSTRGRLHHFAGESSRLQGTPFTHDEFEAEADFLRAVALFAIMYRVVELNQAASAPADPSPLLA